MSDNKEKKQSCAQNFLLLDFRVVCLTHLCMSKHGQQKDLKGEKQTGGDEMMMVVECSGGGDIFFTIFSTSVDDNSDTQQEHTMGYAQTRSWFLAGSCISGTEVH